MSDFGAWRRSVLALSLLAAPAAADEARLPDGRRMTGALALAAGRLTFTPTDGGAPLPIEKVAFVQLNGPSPAPFRAGVVRRVVLRDGERFTGEWLGLDGDKFS